MSLERKLALALKKGAKARNEAYEEIYEAYKGLLCFVATSKGIPASNVDDLVSETFLSFFNYPHKEEIKNIKAFLVTSLERRCIDVLRNSNEEALEEEIPSSDAMGEFIEELRTLLGEEDFSLLYDYVVLDYSSKELARQHNLSPAAVRQRIKRIKSKARAFLED